MSKAIVGGGAEAPAAVPGEVHGSGRRANYVLVLLTIIYALNFLDRNVINILVEPIKSDLGLSDTMLGFLTGFGFVLFYSLLGLPLARLADRKNRIALISISVGIWSVMTALSGMATNFVQLALARFGVGIGEAGGTAPSQSLIADYFPRERRARAMSIYATGTYLGIFGGYALGGYVNQHYGWRAAFMIAGLPGIIIALLLWLTVRELPRGNAHGQKTGTVPGSWLDAVKFLLSQKSFVLIVIGFCISGFTSYSLSVWIPAFLKRIHHMGSSEIGLYAGSIKGLIGIGGVLIGGVIIQRLSNRNVRWITAGPAITSALACPATLLFLFGPNRFLSLTGLAMVTFLISFHLGPIFAVMQSLAKVQMRAFAAAVGTALATLVGLGLGPLVIGMLSDGLTQRFGAEAIRYSLCASAGASLLAALFFLLAVRHIESDMQRSSI